MAEFVLKYADPQGGVHEEVLSAGSASDLRDRFTERGMLVYSVKPRRALTDIQIGAGGGRLNLEQFIIFNEQFVTLTRAGLPILKSLDLLTANIKNKTLSTHIQAIHEDVRTGTPLSEAFRKREIFPAIYTTSLLAGERSGALDEVVERYVKYQKLALAIRKKILVSLIYPTALICLVLVLIVFLVTFVVPEFSALYESMDASLPYSTQVLVAVGVTTQEHALLIFGSLAVLIAVAIWVMRTATAGRVLDRFKLRAPIFGQIWIKYQVAQLSRLMSTLLQGGIPLMQTLETTSQSIGSQLIRDAMAEAREKVREGRPLSKSLLETGVFPSLSVEMIHVGETTGALPQMLTSVAEFFDDEVQTKMAALLSLVEPAIMIFMGIFVAFVLISLYLPIFTLAEQI